MANITDYAIYMLDPNGIVTNWNLGAQRFKGYTPEEIIGQNFERFLTEEDRSAGVPAQILETAAREGRYETEAWRVRKDGTRFWASVVLDAIRDETGTLLGFAKITRDISERRKHEERLLHLAHFDTLTELPNRFSLRAKIDDTIASRSCATVLMLDLDGFKEVNDALGHTAGDVVLKAAGARIQNCIGDQGIVGRLGGDEFAVLLPNVGNPTVAAKLCERLIEAFRVPFVWEAQDVTLGLSIGVAMSPAHGSTAEELLTSADSRFTRPKPRDARASASLSIVSAKPRSPIGIAIKSCARR